MNKIKFLLPVMLLVLLACNSQESENDVSHDSHQHSEMKDEQKDNKQEHDETAGKVQLDNVKKWKANTETITGINNMSSLVNWT